MSEPGALKTYSSDSTREDLNAFALTLGIEAPEKYPNKTELLAVISEVAGSFDATVPPAAAPVSPVGEGRTESYEATRPNGERVRVTRNIDTGKQLVEKVAP